jgi:hypothetical protein
MGRGKWFTRLQSWDARPPRWQRRVTVMACLFTPICFYVSAIFALYGGDHGGLYGVASCINSLSAIWLAMLLLRSTRRNFSRVSLEDRAQMEYGKAFAELPEVDQDRLKWFRERERREPSGGLDEWDAAMQRDAERRAFWMLRRGLPVLVVVYWMACLSASTGPVRAGLLISAVAISGVMMVVLALPEVIRVWTMPDDAAEPRMVTMEPEA